MQKVPFLDLQAATQELAVPLALAMQRVVDSGWYVGGPECAAFEQAFAAYCEAGHAVGVANGLDALVLGLRALGIGPGDEVIVPSNTFIATWLAVSQVGAVPVPVEPDPGNHNLDPARLEEAITARTRAVMPVHLYGQPADLAPIVAVARRHGLKVLEDAAQAHGARYQGRRIGAHGDAVAWSFYPGKNLGALGDGGGLTTNDPGLAERVRELGNYGSRVKYVNEHQGVNSRLDPLQAAVLVEKLAHLDDWNARRRCVAALYNEHLTDCGLRLPAVIAEAEPVWHLYVVRVPGGRRNDLQGALRERGVETLIHYPIPPHRQQAYAHTAASERALPVATALADEVLSLPIGPQLDSAQAQRVVEAVREACRHLGIGHAA